MNNRGHEGMHMESYSFMGMHFFWWMFWVVLWVSFFSFLIPVPRRRMIELRETPLKNLLRRLSNGEIKEKEYEQLKAILERDLKTV